MTEKLLGPHNERVFPSKNYNRGKNGKQEDKRKTEINVVEPDDERGLQQVGRDLSNLANGVIGRRDNVTA